MNLRALVVVGVVLLGGCDTLRRYFSGDELSPGPTSAEAATPSGKPLLLAMREKVQSGRRVVLDRRATRALADLGTLSGVNDKLGQLPELPDFVPLRDALIAVAQRGKIAPGAAQPRDDVTWLLEGSGGLARARAAGQSWAKGGRDAAVALDGLHGLLAAMYAEHDVLELADGVAARALALLAIAEQAGAKPLEAALLARLMGYEMAAGKLAEALPADDPLRAYLIRDPGLYDRVLADKGASPLALSLAHRRALEAGDSDKAARLRARMSVAQLNDAGVHAARSWSTRFREPLALAVVLPVLALADARTLAGKPGAPIIKTVAEVDDQAAAVEWVTRARKQLGVEAETVVELDRLLPAASKDAGAFLAGDLIADHFRSLVGAADEAARQGLFRQLGLHDLTERDLTELLGQRPARFAGGGDWLRLSIELSHGTSPPDKLVAALQRSIVFGPGPLNDMLREFSKTGEWGAPVWAKLNAEIIKRLDSRPAHLPVLMYLAGVRHDIVRHKALDASWSARVGGHGSRIPARVAIEEGRADEVHALMLDPKVPSATKRAAFDELDDAELVTHEDAEAMATALLADDDRLGAADRASELLEKRNPTRARQIAADWLRKHPGEMTVERGNLVALLARLQQAAGDLAGAKKTVEPALQTGAAAPIQRAALIASAQGDHAHALELAQAALARYPNASSVGVVVEVLLRAGQTKEAAKLLAHPPVTITALNLQQKVGPRVLAAIKDEAALVPFIEALQAERFDMQLYTLGNAFERAKRPELAFAVTSRIREPGLAQVANTAVSYRHLKTARGVAAADAWAKQRVPPPMLLPLGVFLQIEGQIDPMFTIVPDPPGAGTDADSLWLCKAAALLMLRETSGPRWERMIAHYQRKDGSYYHTVGRHLVGLEPESAAIAVATDPRRACEIATYLAALALSQGRIADAVDWLQVTLQNNDGRLTEYTLALRVANTLERSHRSLEWMTKNAKWPM